MKINSKHNKIASKPIKEQAVKPLVMQPTYYQPGQKVSPQAPARRTPHIPHPHLWKRYKRLWITLIFIPVIIVLVAGSWIGWKLFTNASQAANGNALGFLRASDLNGEERGRVNILLTGNSADDEGHSGSKLTDSIMIVSIDVKTNKAYLLSIPRDFYVKIPGYNYSKINAAYVYGDRDGFTESGYAGGGIGLLEKTLEQTLAIPIDHHVLINYAAFRDAVNAVGGIDVNIQSSDARGIFDPNINNAEGGPIKLANGIQHLDGQTALNLARSRNDPPPDGRIPYGLPRGDYDRAANQRLMLVALKERAFAAGTLSNPIKVGKLLDGFGTNVSTDMKTSQIRRLYDLFKTMDTANIQSLSLSDPEKKITLIKGATIAGSSTQIPSEGLGKYGAIQAYIVQINGATTQ